MYAKELIELLEMLPKDTLILADVIGQTETAEVTDVLMGGGTLKGFAYLEITPYEGIGELQSASKIVDNEQVKGGLMSAT